MEVKTGKGILFFFLGGGGGGGETFPVEKTIPVDFRPEQPVLQMYANEKRSFP